MPVQKGKETGSISDRKNLGGSDRGIFEHTTMSRVEGVGERN